MADEESAGVNVPLPDFAAIRRKYELRLKLQELAKAAKGGTSSPSVSQPKGNGVTPSSVTESPSSVAADLVQNTRTPTEDRAKITKANNQAKGNSSIRKLHTIRTGRQLVSDRRKNHRRIFQREEDLPPRDKTTGVYGRSYRESKMIFADTWHPPTISGELPTTDAEKCALVKRLREAVLNTEDVLDNINSHVFESHWSKDGENAFRVWEVDRVCWEVLEYTIKLHTVGFTHHNFDKEIGNKQDTGITFTQRIEVLEVLFHDWKCVCDAIMKGEKIENYVIGPVATYKKTLQNKDNNRARKTNYIRRSDKVGSPGSSILHDDLDGDKENVHNGPSKGIDGPQAAHVGTAVESKHGESDDSLVSIDTEAGAEAGDVGDH